MGRSQVTGSNDGQAHGRDSNRTNVSPVDGASPIAEPLSGVSIVMPVLNEEHHLEHAVKAVLDQDWPGALELVLALGPSRDRTDEVAARLAAADPRIRTVRNPTGRTPAGLNAAIAVARHACIVRVDGHAEIPPDYVRQAVETLNRTGADNVGGIMAAEGRTPFERAVARAMTSVLGVGAASFHTGGTEGPADTVYLGAFRRSALTRVGGYDETFVRAQDWEMNHRLRATGGLVWFNPDLKVTYRPRPSVAKLARQYFEYGRWRREVMRRHPETAVGRAALRYFAPPILVVGLITGVFLGSIGVPWGWLAPAGYAVLVVGGSAVIGRGLDLAAWLRLPLAIATMHVSWGFGFLTSPPTLRA
jgi:glycosyltransferase involved in cell wall biosynthesis